MPVKFSPGRLLITPNAQANLTDADIRHSLSRHLNGDWGDLDQHDRQMNDSALNERARFHSVYSAANGTRFWIITEADRSATTILLPDDY